MSVKVDQDINMRVCECECVRVSYCFDLQRGKEGRKGSLDGDNCEALGTTSRLSLLTLPSVRFIAIAIASWHGESESGRATQSRGVWKWVTDRMN